jgi:hypothetical protein
MLIDAIGEAARFLINGMTMFHWNDGPGPERRELKWQRQWQR